MIIKTTSTVRSLSEQGSHYETVLYSGVSNVRTNVRKFDSGQMLVDMFFRDTEGVDHSITLCGTAYIMSDSGKTVDTIIGGEDPFDIVLSEKEKEIGFLVPNGVNQNEAD